MPVFRRVLCQIGVRAHLSSSSSLFFLTASSHLPTADFIRILPRLPILLALKSAKRRESAGATQLSQLLYGKTQLFRTIQEVRGKQ
jgi:hypothetical protein